MINSRNQDAPGRFLFPGLSILHSIFSISKADEGIRQDILNTQSEAFRNYPALSTNPPQSAVVSILTVLDLSLSPRSRDHNSQHSNNRHRLPQKHRNLLTPLIALPDHPILMSAHADQNISDEDSCFAGREAPGYEVGVQVLGAARREVGGGPGYAIQG